ncbi:MAG: transporter substrate-binding domain-containing protein [Dehalococcoidia bacterium]
MGCKRTIAAALLLWMSLVAPAGAGEVQGSVGRKLIVGTKQAPPFAMKNPDGSWSGISIDLWRAIASELNYSYELRELDLQGLLDKVRDGSLDVAVAALTITAERERLFDFTHPFYTTGLGIAVAKRREGGWLSLVRGILSAEFLQVIAFLTLLLLVLGVLIWLFEKKRNPSQFGGGPASGIFSGFWWAAVTMTTVGYGDKAPVTFWGRVVATIWMFVGIIAISAFIAAVTSALTVDRLESSIRGPEDLARARVATVANSAAEGYLRERRLAYRTYKTLLASLRAVAEGESDAVVYDEPLLRYLVITELQGKVEVLPRSFERQHYGIALPSGSDLREPINPVLLEKIGGPWWQEVLYRYLGK